MIWAIIKLQKEGLHYWKDAPTEVAFLRNKHRHLFHIVVYIQQNQSVDRDVEYIQFKHFLETLKIINDERDSCEAIATNLKELIEDYFNNTRKVKVEVTEDNENGALVE